MRKIFKALALAAICASGFSGPALAQPTDAQLSELQNSKIEINYEEPKAASLLPLYERLQKRRVLEDLKAFLSPLRLPRKLTLKTKQCDQINAFYSSSEGLILCYEYIENAEKIAPEKPTPEGFTRQEAFAGGIVDAALHELGHAVFDIFDAPVFGREEDGADQVAAFVMTQFSKDVTRWAIKGAAYWYLRENRDWSRTMFSDEHGTDRQRYYNYLCVAYGGDAAEFRDFVDKGLLPEARAASCVREYDLIKRAFVKTILPFVDQELMRKVQAIRWLRPEDGK